MINNRISYNKFFIILVLAVIFMWLINVSLGSVMIPFIDIVKYFTGQQIENQTYITIIEQLRIPKSFTAIIVGMGLSITGLLMQTLFRNPMAGPSVLGISSGASLGVAILILGSSIFGMQHFESIGYRVSIIFSAVAGSMVVLFLIFMLSLTLKNNLSVLIVGLMISAMTSSLVGILSYFSTAERLQNYLFWGFGNIENLKYSEILILFIVVSLGILIILPLIKPLNSLLLGENFAKSIGVKIETVKNTILLISGLIVGILTAYVGPIAFVGLAVPHIARLIFKTSDHKILFPAVLLLGSLVMLLCDTISQLPYLEQKIPINAVTSLIGAPIVIFLIIRQKKYQF